MLEFLQSLLTGTDKIMMLCAIGLTVEYFRPAEKHQPASAILFNLIWIVNFVVMTNLAMMLVGRLVPMGVAALGGPLFHIQFAEGWIGGLGQFFLLLLIHDFCYYWFHRCQHTWAWFWAHHKLHHTEVHMNATTSFRHHWMENVYRIPFIFIPMGLFNIEGSYTVLVWDAALLWAIFTHVNLRLSMGPLTRFIAGPQVHRIHHSSLPEHQNRNFAAFFPIWDQLFGSFHMPRQNEFPPCGMTDGETTDSVWQAHFGVFKDWYGLWKNRKAGRPASAPAAVPVASENA
ncbi:MAG: sterol desaturase family protein [Lysobacterales bacterium]